MNATPKEPDIKMEPLQNQQEVTLSKLQSLYKLLSYADAADNTTATTTTTTRTRSPSLLQATDCNNDKLSGRRVKVPLTSKAFFEGTLEPRTARRTSGTGACTNTAVKNGDCEGADANAGCEEQIIMNLGKGYMVEMSRSEACDYLDKRMKMKPFLQMKAKKNNKLQLKRGFLNNGKKKKGNRSASSTVNEQKKVEEKKDVSTYGSNSSIPSTFTQTPMPMLPFIEIREEYDKDGNEIKAEALNVSKELLNFQRELKSKKDNMENSTTASNAHDDATTAKNDIVDVLLDNLPNNLNNNHNHKNFSDNNMSSKNHINDENDTNTTIKEIKNRTERHFEETTASSSTISKTKIENALDKTTADSSSSSDFDDISSRLDRLILLEEQHEKKRQEDKRSSKRLRGKGWAKGFFLDDKNKATTSTTLNSSSSSVRSGSGGGSGSHSAGNTGASTSKGTASLPSQSGSENIHQSTIHREEDRVRNNGNDIDIVDTSQRTKRRVVKFQPSDEVKEIPRIGTRSIPSPHSNVNVIQNMVESVQVPKRNFTNSTSTCTTTLRNNTNYNAKRETVSIGGVVERSHGERNNNDNDDDQRRKVQVVRGQILQNNVDAKNSETAISTQLPKKKLSRFAQRRQQQRQA